MVHTSLHLVCVCVCVCVFACLLLEFTDTVLQYATKWNTNARHCLVAQSVLSLVLRWQTPEKLIELDDIKSLVEGFIPYTERHFQRLSRLQQV